MDDIHFLHMIFLNSGVKPPRPYEVGRGFLGDKS